jgi:hypothetical protein
VTDQVVSVRLASTPMQVSTSFLVRLVRLLIAVTIIAGAIMLVGSRPAVALSGNEGLLVPVGPLRIADTRPAPLNVNVPVGQVGANSSITIPVAGVSGLPSASQISAVALNVTVTNVVAPGFVTLYPNVGTPPVASNLNFEAGETRAAHVVVALSAAGTLQVYAGASPADIVIDVSGYYMSAAGSATGYMLETPTAPDRLIDSRDLGTPGAISAFGTKDLCVSSVGGPSLIAINITMIAPAQGGFVTVWPQGATRPNASTINAAAGEVVSNYAVIPLSSGDCISLYSNVQVHYIVDLFARWVDPVAFEGRFVPLAAPTRYYDTRNGSGIPPTGVLEAGNIVNLQLGGKTVNSTVPVPTSARAVLFNLTTVNAFGPGYMTVYRGGDPIRPFVSNVNFVVEQALPNMVLTRINPSVGVSSSNSQCTATGSGPQVAGCAAFFHYTGGNFIVDVAGYYTAS